MCFMKNSMRKTDKFLALTIAMSLLIPGLSVAQESQEEIVARLAFLGDGVHEVKKNENGTLRSLKVVGSSRISTVLGKAKGLQMAQRKATMKANQAFLEWFKSEVSAISTDNEETIVTLEGAGENLTEQGKATEKSRNDIAIKAQGLERGLSLVAKDQTEDTTTLIYLWSHKRANMAKGVERTNRSDKPAQSKSNAKPSDVKITPKRVVSPDFDE